MAEFGELRPGTEWRTPDGQKAKVAPCVVVKWQSGGLSGATEKFWPDDREDQDEIAGWVPWVEPIAVGDRIIVDCWADHDVHHKACATFTDDGADWVTIRLGFSSGPNFKTLRADECRKVNDE